MDPFDAFDSSAAPSGDADPAADFLAREQAELAKIENNDDFFNSTTDNTQANNQDNFSEFDSEKPSKQDAYSSIASVDKLVKEPEKIKKWREEQKQRIAEKDALEEKKMKEMKEVAKKELEEWYKNRQEQLVKTIENNRLTNKASEAEIIANRDAAQVGHEWERVTKLCDFNPKANKNNKDVNRMRSLLLQLKQQPLVR